MAHIVLFHHALGLTPGVLAFAGSLREAGHTVDAPDLYEGATFPNISLGVAHAENLGFDTVIDRGVAAAGHGEGRVYAGFSLGVLPAQQLAQTAPGAKGALLYHGAVPPEMLGSPWPAGLPVQMHFMESDPWGEEDLEAARELAASVERAELFTYPGSGHLFADPGVGDYDAGAAALLLERSLAFLAGLG
ncbi:MAG: dienelactone hydrolase family protein [Actinobacteria bacterium]|nr:dienelactone hydrolase family protein [Actinomycetota bacterium]